MPEAPERTGALRGKVAFITGAARGQGRSHAVRLAEEGADIIAVDVCDSVETVDYPPATANDLAQTAELVTQAGGRIVTATVDVRDFGALSAAVARGVDELGRLDIVCANAGILTMGMSHELSEEQWRTIVEINLTGAWHTSKVATPYLIRQGEGGSLIFTSSTMGLKGGPFASAYATTKHGIVGLAKSLAMELAQFRIRSNVLHPTTVRSPMIDNPITLKSFRPDLDAPTSDDATPILRMLNLINEPWIESSAVSEAVVYLSSKAGESITGISLPIDLGAAAK